MKTGRAGGAPLGAAAAAGGRGPRAPCLRRVDAAAPPATATPAAVAATAQAARLENQDRAKRGLAGTIATSERGVLAAAAPLAAPRKTLLGE